MTLFLQLAIAIACLCYSTIALRLPIDRTPVEYFVGNWTSGANFTGWSQGKTIYSGDTLVFSLSGSQIVLPVDKNAYDGCKPGFLVGMEPPPLLKKASWNWTVVPLVGDNYYISPVEADCEAGLKLAVNVVLPPLAPAPPMYTPKSYTVGDDKGWALGVDFTQWVLGKRFYFGDKFVFNFNATEHSLVQFVGLSEFQTCNLSYSFPVPAFPIDLQHRMEDNVSLAVIPPLERQYYASPIGSDCTQGLKVALDILSPDGDDGADAPTPSPGASAQAESGSPMVLSFGLIFHMVFVFAFFW